MAWAAGWARTEAARSATAVSASTKRRVMNASSPSPRDLRSSPTTRAGLLRNFLYENISTPPRQGRFSPRQPCPTMPARPAASRHAHSARAPLRPPQCPVAPAALGIRRRPEPGHAGLASLPGPVCAPPTTAMWRCSGPDHHDVALPWFGSSSRRCCCDGSADWDWWTLQRARAFGVRGPRPPSIGGRGPLTPPIGRRADAAVTGGARRVGPAGFTLGAQAGGDVRTLPRGLRIGGGMGGGGGG